MENIDKTKEQLLDELEALRQRIAGLEVLETELEESVESSSGYECRIVTKRVMIK